MAEIYTPQKNSCGKSIFVCHILHKQFRFLIAIVSLDSFKMCFHFLKGSSIFKMYFHFQNLLLSFFKSALIFKMCFHFCYVLSFLLCAFISKMCFHFHNVLSFSKCAFTFKMRFHFWDVLFIFKWGSNEHNFLYHFLSKIHSSRPYSRLENTCFNHCVPRSTAIKRWLV